MGEIIQRLTALHIREGRGATIRSRAIPVAQSPAPSAVPSIAVAQLPTVPASVLQRYPNDATKYLLGNGTWAAPAATFAGPGAPVTSLPGSPTDGQQAILVDSTSSPTYAWLLQWSATASKWIFIGGSPIVSINTSGTLGTTSATYTDFASTPSITLPRAGNYVVRHGASFYGGTANVSTFVALKKGSAASADVDAVSSENLGGNGVTTGAKTIQANGMSASDVLKQQVKVSSGTVNVQRSFIEATPVWVT